MNRVKNKRIILSAIYAFLTSLAMNMSLNVVTTKAIEKELKVTDTHAIFRLLWDFKCSLGTYSVEALIIIVLLGIFYYKMMSLTWKKSKAVTLGSLAMAFFQVFGMAFKVKNDWSMIFETDRNIIKAIIVFAGYFILFRMSIKALILLIKKFNIVKEEKNKKSWFTDNTKSLFIVAGIILLLWLPYFIVSLPALTNYDFFDMLDSFYGIDTNSLRVVNLINPDVTLNNNNPVIQSLMAVGFMKIGNLLGSPDIGVFLFVAVQAVLFALVLSYVIRFMARQKIRRSVRVGLLLLYALLPINANFAFTTLKDTNFAFTMILYLLLIIQLVQNSEEFCSSKKRLAMLGVIAFAMMMLRNNGLYVVALSAIIFIIAFRKQWKKIVLPLFAPIVLFMFVTNVIYPALQIAPGSKAEAYSIPLQQTARLLKEHSDDMPEEDKEKIENIFYVDNEYIIEHYDPVLSDPVKSRFDKTNTDKEMSEYFGVWFKYLWKYTDVYVQATMSNCYGYFYPEAESWIVYLNIAPTGEPYGLRSPEKLDNIRNEVVNLAYVFRKIPGLGLLESIGFYTWCLIFGVVALLYYRKKKGILMMVPVIILILTSIAGPANTMMRYVYPMILGVPIYMIMMVKWISGSNEAEVGVIETKEDVE